MKLRPLPTVTSTEAKIRHGFGVLAALLLTMLRFDGDVVLAQPSTSRASMAVGVARVDITPAGPIRLAGYGAREKTESRGIIHRLHAKALAFGTDEQGASVFITVDLLGIPGHIRNQLADKLATQTGLDPANLVICASHTHGAPEVGNALNILQYRGSGFSDSLLALDHLVHISQYAQDLGAKLEQVALAALRDRRPAHVGWTQGQAGFAKNRRARGGPVDPALPMLSVTAPDGKLRAVLVNYACHGTTLGGEVNQVHGDWMAEAQAQIESRHQGATALVAIGCAGDSNPDPRGEIEHMRQHGQEIASQVDKLLKAQLEPLHAPPVCRMKWVKLPFAKVPSVDELIAQTSDRSIKGYYARLALDRIARGEDIPSELNYPVQTWTFGKEFAMVNLAGEVVADYSVRLKNELGAEKLWVNAYANDVPCYIASRRVINEGGYEAESSMYWYDKPSPFAEGVEEIIIAAVRDLLPKTFTVMRPAMNELVAIRPQPGDTVHLTAAQAQAIGPAIKYMPEWKAFGWFTERDRVEWTLELDKRSKYDVYLDWSVPDQEAGKPFVLQAGGLQIRGRVATTGSWFTYRKERIGSLQLAAGKHTVVFRPGPASAKGALLDLREVTFVPVP